MIFNYADGLNNDSNTVPVQAGINAAFRPTANYISIPNTSDISTTSNVDIPGVWMFQTGARPFTTPSMLENIRSYTYTPYIANCLRWKSFVVFVDQSIPTKLFQ